MVFRRKPRFLNYDLIDFLTPLGIHKLLKILIVKQIKLWFYSESVI